MRLNYYFVLFLLVFNFTAFASKSEQSGILRESTDFENWIQFQTQVSIKKIKENISPAHTAKGVVIASPQKANPDYFRNWIRDAGLTMDVIFTLLKGEKNDQRRRTYENMMKDYVYFSRQNQLAHTLTGLGEPIFEVDGKPFSGPWGRPQNDGPAIRAYVLTRYANYLLDQGKTEFVKTWLYSAQLPARTIIKADLEYVSHHWDESNFDLWEETKGDHFYTHMVQRRALFEGARLALRLHDEWASDWYSKQGWEVEQKLKTYWHAEKKLIQATVNRTDGADYKHSNLDMAVILGVLHGELDRDFSVTDGRVAETFIKLVESFAELYSINKQKQNLGVALGRYPEDKYAGTDFNGGNPWFLTTLAAAEYLFKLAEKTAKVDKILAAKLMQQGDLFLNRVRYHVAADGSMSEQMNRYTGFMVSASDLTWSYSAFLTAIWAREKAQGSRQ